MDELGIRLDGRYTGEVSPLALRLMPWEKYWQDEANIDFMREDPDEANHPIRVRMGNEATRVAKKIENPRVLDIGCGTAIDYPRLRDLGFDYWAIEPIPKFIDRARELYPEIKIIQDRVWDIPFNDKVFDVSWMKGVVQHLPPGTYPEALDEAWRVTKTLLMVSTNRVFFGENIAGVTHREKGGPYDNHYNFNEFYGHVKKLPNSFSRYVKGFIKGDEEDAKEKGLVHTLFLIYDREYWMEHYARK